MQGRLKGRRAWLAPNIGDELPQAGDGNLSSVAEVFVLHAEVRPVALLEQDLVGGTRVEKR